MLLPTGTVTRARFSVPGGGYASVRGILDLADPDELDGVSGRFAHRTDGGNEGLDGAVTDESELGVFVVCGGELGA